MGITGIKFVRSMTAAAFLFGSIFQATTLHSFEALMPLQKGMCYVTWDKDRFATKYSDQSLEKLAGLGVEFLSVCTTHYQESYNSTDIRSTDKTPSRRSVKHVIKRAHKLGLKVMLKPHIDLIDKYDGTYWRADIGFACEEDWQKWFKNYKKMIVRYARLAERYDVEILCVGTELAFTTQRDSDWREVIKEVKKIYDGKLVYAANWDNFKNIRFWDMLDYIGIDAYFPLTYSPNPSIEELKEGWNKWKYEISSWQKEVGRQVIFTELGYPSTAHAPYTPWKNAMSGNPDPTIQAKCYLAFFETIWQEPWFAGVYWWKWDTNTRAGGPNNRQFTPQNKPAQEIMTAHYKGTIETMEIVKAKL